MTSRITQTQNTELAIEDIAAEFQRGVYQTPAFSGAISSHNGGFKAAVDTALKFSGATILRDEITETPVANRFSLNQSQYNLLQKRANSIASYGNIPFDVAEDFLLILVFINNINDMRIIAEELDIPELDDESILRKPEIILNIPNLEKMCFCAQALSGIISLFKKYPVASQVVNSSPGESIFDIVSALVMGSGGIPDNLIDGGSPANLVGNFLSELITGERIPTNVIAKNPNNQSPSYVGKAFFSEAATALASVDITEIFNKKIAVFPIPSAGAGVTSFNLQNSKTFSNTMNLNDFVAKVNFGNININTSYKQNAVNGITNKINNMLGTTDTETVDLRRADNAIPLMMSLSAVYSNRDSSPFTADTFKNAWVDSNSLGDILNKQSPVFMETVKRFL